MGEAVDTIHTGEDAVDTHIPKVSEVRLDTISLLMPSRGLLEPSHHPRIVKSHQGRYQTSAITLSRYA